MYFFISVKSISILRIDSTISSFLKRIRQGLKYIQKYFVKIEITAINVFEADFHNYIPIKIFKWNISRTNCF